MARRPWRKPNAERAAAGGAVRLIPHFAQEHRLGHVGKGERLRHGEPGLTKAHVVLAVGIVQEQDQRLGGSRALLGHFR